MRFGPQGLVVVIIARQVSDSDWPVDRFDAPFARRDRQSPAKFFDHRFLLR
jgi:hypothetical protein